MRTRRTRRRTSLFYITIAVALVCITIWQVGAGIERCGAIDGGALLAPLIPLTWYLIRGMTRDLREVFNEEQERSANW